MDVYAFLHEAGSAGLAEIAELETVRVVMPTVGEYAAYVALYGDDPGHVLDDVQRIREVPDVLGVDAYVALTDASVDAVPKTPMPTRVAMGRYVCFALVTTDPGAAAEVHAAVARIAAASAVVAGTAPLVLAEVTADSLEEIAARLDEIGQVPRVRDVSSSIGVGWYEQGA